MKKNPSYPWLLLLAGLGGIFGLTAWHFYQVRYAVEKSNARWVDRVSQMVTAERDSLNHWIEDVPADEPLHLARIAQLHADADALLLIDQTMRIRQRWSLPELREKLEPLDPRLPNVLLRGLQTSQTQAGPLLWIDQRPYFTVIRPLDDERALVAFIQASELPRMLEDECRLWHAQAYVFDNARRPIFTSGNLPMIRTALAGIINLAESGVNSGFVPLKGLGSWQWLATFHRFPYDATSDWIFIILQWVPWTYIPFLLFLLSLSGVLILARVPFRAAEALHQRAMSHALRNFALRVDNFIRGRDPYLKDPPHPYQELAPVVMGLRWLMPQWKKAENFPKELALERKLLSLLVESLPEGILFFNAQGGLQLSNELGRVFLALQQEAGHESRMVSGVQVPRGFLEPYLEPVFTGAQGNLGKEVEVPWADGKHLYRIWVERVEGEAEKAEGFIVVVRDVTFRKQWEYVQEQVLSGITHDLRGPLSAVMGYLDLIRKQMGTDAPPKLQEYVRLAREGGVRLSQMVSDILDVVRFEQGKIDLEVEPISIAETFERLQHTFGVMAEQKKVSLKLLMQGDATLRVNADRKLLDRVFDNLVGNAIKFTPMGGTITVTGRRAQDRFIFEVGDTGRGIPREAQSRIFDKFQQVRPGDRSSGYGLGLAVAKFIVEAHKGEIRVESEVGVGSKFTFWIPTEGLSSKTPVQPIVSMEPNQMARPTSPMGNI
jgi:signal transduction histidine kinase